MRKTLIHTSEEKERGKNSSGKGNQVISGAQKGVKTKARNVIENLKENTIIVSTRLIFLRHLPYRETPDYIRYNEILKEKIDGKILSSSEISELRDLTEKLEILQYSELKNNSREKKIYDDILSDPENTLLIFNADKEINPNISKNGTELANIGGDKLENIIVRMPKTDKGKRFGENMVIVSKSFDEIYEIIDTEIKKGKYKKIVLLGNRSYAHEFDLKILGNRQSSVTSSVKQLEKKGYFIADYDNKGNFIEGNYLTINHDNFEEILSEVSEILPFEEKDISQTELQNYINQELVHNNELLKKYLYSKNAELMLLCLRRLYKKNITKSIEDFIRSKKFEPNNLKEIFKILIKDKEAKDSDKKLWVFIGVKIKLNEIINLNNEFGISKIDEKEIDEIKLEIDEIREITKRNIGNVFSNSLDDKIKKGEGIIERKKYKLVEISKEEQEKLKKEKKEKGLSEELTRDEIYYKEFVNFEDIIMENEAYIHAISANVGDGKSTELANFARKIIYNSEYNEKFEVIYISSKDISRYSTLEDILRKCFNLADYLYEKKVVLITDGFDELNKDEIGNSLGLLRFLIASQEYLYGKERTPILILGTRESRLSVSGGEYGSLGKKYVNLYSFESLNNNEIGEFIKSRLIYLLKNKNKLKLLDSKIEEINNFINAGIIDIDIKSTPLILYLICELSSSNKLSSVTSRAELYELVVKGIMSRHNKEESDITIGHNLDDLGIIAFNKYISDNNIELEGKELKLLKKLKTKDVSRYSILFINPRDENPIFIHNSFYEYFLARHIAVNPGLEKYIYQFRDNNKTSWSEWRKLKPIIQFFGEIVLMGDEIIENNRDFDGLEKFLGENGILANDDIYGESFFNGLEILIKLETKYGDNDTLLRIKAQYLDRIWKFTKEDVINKINGFIEFQERIGYKENQYIDILFDKIIKNWTEFDTIFGITGDSNKQVDYLYDIIMKIGSKKAITFLTQVFDENGFRGEIGNQNSLLIIFNGIVNALNLAISTGRIEYLNLGCKYSIKYFSDLKPGTPASLINKYIINNKKGNLDKLFTLDEIRKLSLMVGGLSILYNLTAGGNIIAKKILLEIAVYKYNKGDYLRSGKIYMHLYLSGELEYKNNIANCLEKSSTKYSNDRNYYANKFLFNLFELGDMFSEQLLEEYLNLRLMNGGILIANLILKGKLVKGEKLEKIINQFKDNIQYGELLEIYLVLAEKGNADDCNNLIEFLEYLKTAEKLYLVNYTNEILTQYGGKKGNSFYLSHYKYLYMNTQEQSLIISRIGKIIRKSGIGSIDIFCDGFNDLINSGYINYKDIKEILYLTPKSKRYLIYNSLDSYINNMENDEGKSLFIESIFKIITHFDDLELISFSEKYIDILLSNIYKENKIDGLNDIISNQNNSFNDILFSKIISNINSGKYGLVYGLHILLSLLSRGNNTNTLKHLYKNVNKYYKELPLHLLFGEIYIELYLKIKDSKKTLIYKHKIIQCLEHLSLNGNYGDYLYLIKKITTKNIPELRVFIQLLPEIINKLIPWGKVNVLSELKSLNIKIPEYQEDDSDTKILL